MPLFWWMRLDFVFLVGRSASGGVFWDVCDLIMILDILSANGWGCVPVYGSNEVFGDCFDCQTFRKSRKGTPKPTLLVRLIV